ncbi:MAG TPA: NAD-dependent epimerase/dehydratase family protein, partial [Alphaproteobacteria bacterium]|nr:NAD-dependent epimerase/dehydratase family protein [Alphaproteobacteria bacterium]
VYGDGSDAARHEEDRLDPLSPYAVTKYANELYARVLGDFHGLPTIGLRYFNIYGPRQDPQGPYAAVIPRWINALRQGQAVEIHGDGQTVRDFCFVEDVVQANLLAALSAPLPRPHPVYNIASGCPTTLNTLLETLRRALNRSGVNTSHCAAFHTSSRPMDIRVSRADIAAARDELGFVPAFDLEEGLFKTLENNFTDRIVAA